MLRIKTLLSAAILSVLGASAVQAGPFDPPAVAYPTYRYPHVVRSPFVPQGRPVIVRPQYHDHVHVQYRLPYWREQVFGNLFFARNFEQEQISKGFEVSTVCLGDQHIVRYRMMGWNTYQTTDGFRDARDIERYLESRGYQVRLVPH